MIILLSFAAPALVLYGFFYFTLKDVKLAIVFTAAQFIAALMLMMWVAYWISL